MPFPPSLGRLGRLTDGLSTVASQLLASARGIAFWAAIALPLGYLPLFTVDAVRLSLEAFVLLLVLNIVALVVGHSYQR